MPPPRVPSFCVPGASESMQFRHLPGKDRAGTISGEDGMAMAVHE